MTKTIGMVLDDYYPPDIRVAKEAYSLIKAGNKVHILCMRKTEEKYEESIDGLQVHRIDVAKNKVQKGIWDVIASITFVHPIYHRALQSFVKNHGIEVLHIHDLPLCKTGIKVGARLKIPVICDFHENFPEALRIWFKWRTNPIIRFKNWLFFGYRRWKNYEGWVSRKATHLIAVVDEMKDKLRSDFSIEPDKVTVVTNSESRDYINQPYQSGAYASMQGQFVIAYLGNVGPHRGIDTAIRGMAHLKGLPIQLAVVGRVNPNVKDQLERLVTSEKVEDQVTFFGYQPFDKFFSYMSDADVNLIPHNFNGHTNNTIPHKLFQSMMVGKPLVVSSCKPLKRIVEETQSGLVFDADNPEDYARCVRQLFDDRELGHQLGENGRKHSLEGDYNWETTATTLVQLYEDKV